MRTAAGLTPEESGRLAGISGQTIRNWEGEAGAKTYFKILLYIRALAERSDLAKDMILGFLGVRGVVERNPHIEAKLDMIRAAYESRDPVLEAQLTAVELLLKERLGEQRAASA